MKVLSSGAEQGRGETDRQRLKRETVDWIVGGPEGTGLDARYNHSPPPPPHPATPPTYRELLIKNIFNVK